VRVSCNIWRRRVRRTLTVGKAVLSVQFSSVQFSSNGVVRRPSLPDPSGASDREGTARRNWHGWKSGAGMLTPVPRVERARPASDEFLAIWRFGQTRAAKAAMAADAEAARAVEGVIECAPHPVHALSYACVCARDTGVCNMPWVQQRRCWRRTLREREQQREAGRRRRGQQATARAAAAVRLGERMKAMAATWAAWASMASTSASSRTGLSTRGN
jgi:hypothetical protein